MSDVLITLGDLEAFTTHRAITLTRAAHLAKEFDLVNAWEYFWDHNMAAGLCYHNRYHSCWLMGKVEEMAREMELHGPELRQLILAAMFHDINHTGSLS